MKPDQYPSWGNIRRELVDLKDTEESAKNFIDYIVSTVMSDPSRDSEKLLHELGRKRYNQMYQIFRFFINENPEDTRVWDLYELMMNANKGFGMTFMQGKLFLTNSGGTRGRTQLDDLVVATPFERLLGVYFGYVACEKARQGKIRQARASKRRRTNSGESTLDDADIPTNQRSADHVYVAVLTVVEAWQVVLQKYNITDIDEFTKHFINFNHVLLQLSVQPEGRYTVYRFYRWKESSVVSEEIPEALNEHGPAVLQSMREITGHILADIERVVVDPNYYPTDKAQEYPALAKFVIPTDDKGQPTGALPVRFHDMPDSILRGMSSLRSTEIPAELTPDDPSEQTDRRTRSRRAASSAHRTHSRTATRSRGARSSVSGSVSSRQRSVGSSHEHAGRPPRFGAAHEAHTPSQPPSRDGETPSQPPSRDAETPSQPPSRDPSVVEDLDISGSIVPDIDLPTTSAQLTSNTFQRLNLRTGLVQTKYVPTQSTRHILSEIQHVQCSGEDCECHASKAHLEKKMRLFFRSHACSFEEVVDVDQGAVPDSALAQRNVGMCISDPPFNIRRQSNRGNSAYDFFSRSQINSLIDVTSDVLRPGAMSVVYCSHDQSVLYKDGFTRKTEEHSDDPDKQVSCFQVMDGPYLITMKEGHDGRMPNRHGLYTNIAQEVSIARRMENGAVLAAQPTRPGGFVHSTYRTHTNIMNNVERLPPGEQVRVPSDTEDRSTMALRAEQKSLAELKEFIARHTEDGDTVVDFTSGTNTTGVACVTLPENRRFVGCEVDEVAHRHGHDRMLQAFAERLITDGLTFDDEDAKCTDEDRTHAVLYLSHLEPVREPRESKNWRAPTNLPNFTTLPLHLLTFMGNALGIEGIRRYHRIPVDLWDVMMTSALACTSMESLLGVDLAMSFLEKRRSRIRHPSAGNGLFTTRGMKKGSVIAQVHGTLVYHDISVRVEVTKTYGNGPLGVTVGDFNNFRYDIDVSGDHFKNEDGEIIKVVYLVPAKCSVVLFINDPRYCVGDADMVNNGGEDARTANVELYVSPSSLPMTDRSKICSHTLVELRALKDLNVGEELYMTYPEGVRVE